MTIMKRVLAAVALAGAALTVACTAQAAEPREQMSGYLYPLHDGHNPGIGSEQDYLDQQADF
ncbi:hypothetical protein ACWGHU_10305 [Streptomyces xanthophaeus]